MRIPTLKERLFPLQITKRVHLWTIVLTLIPTVILSVVIPLGAIKYVRTDREKQLYGMVDRLNNRLKLNYTEILKEKGALNKTPEEKVKVLNAELQPGINEIAHSFPGIGMGYYSIELDAVLAINPELKPFKILKVPRENPYFKVYQTGRPESGERNTSIGWSGEPILWYAYPISEKGRIVGHVWANVKTKTIYTEAVKIGGIIFLTWAAMVGVLILLSHRIFKRIKTDLKDFTDSVLSGGQLVSTVLPELEPIQDLLKNHTRRIEEQAEELLRSEQKFYNAFHASPAINIISDIETGKFIDINDQFLQTFGYTREEVVGLKVENLVWDSDVRHQMLDLLLTEGKIENRELCLKNKSGDQVTLLVSVVLIELNGKKYILSSANNVTELRRLENEMARLDCLNVVGQMASGIAHEIRNPMTSVRGFLQLLANKETDTRNREYYSIIIEELDRANSIITEFLALAKDKYVSFRPVSLNLIINALYPLLSSDAIKHDKSIILNKGNIPAISLNEKEMRQLIINLVRNGLEATPAGGVLTIGTYPEKDEVILYVEDEGPGIEPGILDKLGKPFVTTKDNGTGLGLAVCYSIANRHNAKMDFETGPSGTTFYVRFKNPNIQSCFMN